MLLFCYCLLLSLFDNNPLRLILGQNLFTRGSLLLLAHLNLHRCLASEVDYYLFLQCLHVEVK